MASLPKGFVLDKPPPQGLPEGFVLDKPTSFGQRLTTGMKERVSALREAPDAATKALAGARVLTGGLVEPVEAAIAPVMEPIGRAIGKFIPEPVKQYAAGVGERLPEFQRKHPTLTQAAGLGLDVGSLTGAGAAAKGGQAILKSRATAKALDVMPVTGAPRAAPAIGAEATKGISGDIYKASSQYGANFNSKFTSKIGDALSEQKTKSKFTGIGKGGKNYVDDYIDDFNTRMRGEPMNLEDFNTMDSELGDKAYSTMDIRGNLTDDGRRFLTLQRTLREKMENPSVDDITDPSAIKAVQEAGKIHAEFFRLRDIEKIKERARLSDNPALTLKTGFRNLYLNAKATKGYPKEYLKLIEKAAETGALTGVLRTASTKLLSIGAIVYGEPLTAGALYGASRAAGSLAERLQGAPIKELTSKIGRNISERAQRAQELLRTNPPDVVPPAQTPPLALPNLRRQTVEQRYANQRGINERAGGPTVYGQPPKAKAPPERLALPSPKMAKDAADLKARIEKSDKEIRRKIDVLRRQEINKDTGRKAGSSAGASGAFKTRELPDVLKMKQDGSYDLIPPSRQIESAAMREKREFINNAIRKHNKLIFTDKLKNERQ